MVYNLNGKNIKIPDEEIKKNMEILDLSEEEAIQLYLEDEGYLENEEVAELTKKAKDSGIMSTIHGAKAEKPKAKVERERKENPTKERIIAEIGKFLCQLDGISGVNIVNIGKIIEFECENKHFKLDLIQKREKKVK
jgi:hypothetical protein